MVYRKNHRRLSLAYGGVLQVYEQPYDPLWPMICFDERPCFLIEDIGGIIPMSPGTAKRHHYEYQKNGSCCVLTLNRIPGCAMSK